MALAALACALTLVIHPIALVAVAAVGLALGLLASDAALAVALVLATFLSRFSLEVGGFSVRPEIPVAALAILSLLLRGRSQFRSPLPSIITLLLFWVVGLGASSVLFAPDLRISAPLLVWLLLDIGAFAWLATRSREVLLLAMRVGIVAALVSQVLGIVCWIGAAFGYFFFLVQWDPAYGGWAAYATTFEANIFAGLTTLWAIVASSRTGGEIGLRRIRVLVVTLSPLVGIAAHTRAAFVVSLALLAYVAFRSRFKVQYALATPLLALGAILGLGGLSAIPGLDKFANLFDFQSGTGWYRAQSWQQALGDIQQHPMFWPLGAGLNTFGQRHGDPTLRGVPWYLGNVPLQVLHDGGLLAVVLVAAALLLVLNRTTGTARWVFVGAYVTLGSQTSTLWLLQTWIFVALYVLIRRTEEQPAGIPSGAAPVPVG